MIFGQLSSWPLSYPERRSREVMRIQEQQRRRAAVCPSVPIREPPVFVLRRLSPEEAGEASATEDIVNVTSKIEDFIYDAPLLKFDKYGTIQSPKFASISTRTQKKESWGNNWLDDLNAFKNQLKRKRGEDNDKSPIKTVSKCQPATEGSGLHEPKKPRSTYQIKPYSSTISTVPKDLPSASSLFLPPKQQTLPQELKKPTTFQVDKNRASSSSYTHKPSSLFSPPKQVTKPQEVKKPTAFQVDKNRVSSSYYTQKPSSLFSPPKQVTKPQEVIKPKTIQNVTTKVSISPIPSVFNQKLQTTKNMFTMQSMPSLFAQPKQATKPQEVKTVKELNKPQAVKKPEKVDSSQASCSPLPSVSNQQLLPSMPSLLSPTKPVTKPQEIKMTKEVTKPQKVIKPQEVKEAKEVKKFKDIQMDSTLLPLPNQKLQTKKNIPTMPSLFAPPKQVTKLQEIKMTKEVTKPQEVIKPQEVKKPQEIKDAKEVQTFKEIQMDSTLLPLPNQKLQTKKNIPTMSSLFAPPKQVTKLQEIKMTKEITKPQELKKPTTFQVDKNRASSSSYTHKPSSLFSPPKQVTKPQEAKKAEKIKNPKSTQWNRKTDYISSPLLSPQKENRSVPQSRTNQKRKPSTVSPVKKQAKKQHTASQASTSKQIAPKRQPSLFSPTNPKPLSQNSNKTETVATDQSASINQQVKKPSPKYPVLQKENETPNPSINLPILEQFHPVLKIIRQVCQTYEVLTPFKETETKNTLPLPSEDIVDSAWGVINENYSPELFTPLKATSREHIVLTEDYNLLGFPTDNQSRNGTSPTGEGVPMPDVSAENAIEKKCIPTKNILKEKNNIVSPSTTDPPKSLNCRIDLSRILRIPKPIEEDKQKNGENFIQTREEEGNSKTSVKQAPTAISNDCTEADIVENPGIKDEIIATKPRYRSYFEKDEKIEALRKLLSSDRALLEAAHCVCAANMEIAEFDQLALNLEAVIYFLISADGVSQNVDLPKAFKMFDNAIMLTELIKLKCRMSKNFPKKDKKSFKILEILNMRSQSLLFLKLYKFYQSNINEPGKQKYIQYLVSSHDLWDEGDVLVQKSKCIDFFVALDLEIGPMTMHSNLYHVLRYVQEGLDKL